MKKTLFILISFGILLSGCMQHQSKVSQKTKTCSHVKVYTEMNDSLKAAIMKQGEMVVHKSTIGIKTALTNALKSGGPVHALEVCNTQAIPITDSLSKALNVNIKRLAKKNRNPENETQGSENDIYKAYVLNYLKTEVAPNRVEINSDGHPVYYQLIQVRNECLMCHGEVDKNITPEVAAKIKALYPNDKAVDFSNGQPRGMWAITFNQLLIKHDTP